MQTILLVILVILLAIVVYQDFKERAISWFLIPLLFIGFIGYAISTIEVGELITYFGINLYIVFSSLFGATLIISIRNRKLTNIVNTYLGLGDVLFFIVLTIVFSPVNFLLFYLGSIILAGTVYFIVSLLNKKQQVLTPLAGAMSALLIITIVLDQLLPGLGLYYDILIPFE